jgi:hypothetical protein
MTPRSRILLAASAFLLSIAAPVRSQGPADASSCIEAQLERLCSGSKPDSPEFSACAEARGGDAMALCMKTPPSGASLRARAAANGTCDADVQKYCPGLWPGTPEFGACMKSHRSDLSPACAAYAKKHLDGKSPAPQECVADAKKYCPGLTFLDGEKFTHCMVKNDDSLSPACRSKFKGLKDASSGPRADCIAGLKKLCPDMKSGDDNAMMQCMMAHRQDMPASCHKPGKPAAN